MSITLTVLGCSGSTSGPDSAASGYLVQAPWRGRTFTVLLDCGPGVFGALYRHLDPAEVDAVALSHLHPDHCLDLCAFAVAARYGPTAPWPTVPLYAPAQAIDRLGRAYEPTPDDSASTDLGEVFEHRVWQQSQQLGPFTVRTSRVDHPAPCWATRFELDGLALVYSGDTGPSAALVDLARGADLLLCEAAFEEPAPGGSALPPGVHLSGAGAGRHAESAGVARLVVTHVPPWLQPEDALTQARTTFAGPTELAAPDRSWTLR